MIEFVVYGLVAKAIHHVLTSPDAPPRPDPRAREKERHNAVEEVNRLFDQEIKMATLIAGEEARDMWVRGCHVRHKRRLGEIVNQ